MHRIFNKHILHLMIADRQVFLIVLTEEARTTKKRLVIKLQSVTYIYKPLAFGNAALIKSEFSIANVSINSKAHSILVGRALDQIICKTIYS